MSLRLYMRTSKHDGNVSAMHDRSRLQIKGKKMKKEADGREGEYERAMSDISKQCRLTLLAVFKHRLFLLVWIHFAQQLRTGRCGKGDGAEMVTN